MKTIKKHKKLFIGIAVIAALLAAIPVSLAYMVLHSNIGIDLNDSTEEMEAKINNYFEGNGFNDDIINSMRNKATGDFNIYAMHINSSEFNELEKIWILLLHKQWS